MFTSKKRKKKNINKYILIIGGIVLVYFFIVSIWPLAYTLIISFFKSNFLSNRFIGFKNFELLMRDRLFWSSIKNNFIYFGVKAGVGIFLALLLAFLIDSIKGLARKLYTIVFFSPVITPIVATSVVWKLIYFPEFGMLDRVVNALFGIEKLAVLGDTRTALLAIIIMDIWKMSGFWMVIFLAGINDIPDSIYEAAIIDGVSPVGKYFKITIPLLKPQIIFVTAIISISSMLVFRQIYMMTYPAGSPENSTLTMMVHVYKNAFEQYNIGSASTMVLVIITLMVILVNLQRKAFTFSDI